MRRASVVAVIFLAASPAIAGHRHCVEESEVMGYQRCSRFGDGWSGATLSWELGATLLRSPFDAIDRDVDIARDGGTTRYHVTAPAGSFTATALRLRNLYGLTQHFYVASELTFGHVTDMPSFAIEPAVRTTMPVGDQTSGVFFDGRLAAGLRSSLGAVAIGSELAFGPRVAVFSNRSLPGTYFGQGDPVLEARAHASVWLSMHWSVGVLAATNAFDRHDVSMTVSLGLHALPFDGGR